MIKSRLLILLFLLLMSLPLASVSLANTQDCQDGCSSLQAYGLSADEILAYVQPTFERPAVDYNLMNDRRYMRVNGIMEVFDAPNGNFVRMQNAGYNYVTALGEQDGWVRINNNEWVRKDILEDSNGFLSSFSGIFLDGEFPKYPVAWSLNNVYPSKVPGGSPVESNGLTRRYTLLTIYASVMIDGWEWYQIGVDKWMVQTHVGKVSPLDRPAEIDTQRWISIDLFEQVVIVFDGTQPIFATLIASGLPQWQTREGMYHIYFRKSRDDMTGGVVGDDYYLIEEVHGRCILTKDVPFMGHIGTMDSDSAAVMAVSICRSPMPIGSIAGSQKNLSRLSRPMSKKAVPPCGFIIVRPTAK